MNKPATLSIRSIASALAMSVLGLQACSAASSPEQLASSLQAAASKGDFDAAGKLVNFEGAPAELHFYFFDMVRECGSEAACTVSAEPIASEACARIREKAQVSARKPRFDGCLVVTTKAKDGSGSGAMKMPYAKHDSGYRIETMGYSTAELAAARAKTNETLVAELFAKGLRDSATGDMRTDWASAATRLPADGGAIGAAFVAQSQALAKAIDAKDPDAAMRSGGELNQFLFRDKEYDGKPIPMAVRKQKLHVQGLRKLRDVRVSGGYQLGDTAVLLIEAKDGIGWTVRGPIVLANEGEDWSKAGDNLVSYPSTP